MVGISCVDWLQVFSFNRILFQYCNPVWLLTWRSWNLYTVTGIPDESMLLREFERRPTRFERHPKTPPNEPLRGEGKRVEVDCLNCADWCLLWNDDQFSVAQLSVYMTDYITESMACAKMFQLNKETKGAANRLQFRLTPIRPTQWYSTCEQGERPERRKLCFLLAITGYIQICISAWRFQDWPGDKDKEMISSFSVRWKSLDRRQRKTSFQASASVEKTRPGKENLLSCLLSDKNRQTPGRWIWHQRVTLSFFPEPQGQRQRNHRPCFTTSLTQQYYFHSDTTSNCLDKKGAWISLHDNNFDHRIGVTRDYQWRVSNARNISSWLKDKFSKE